MKAVVYDSARHPQVRDVPVPEPGPGQVRIRTVQTGFCGTDLHLHEGGFGALFPLQPGHEVVGVVDALTDGVEGLSVGELVAVNPNVPCRRCDHCRAGRPVLCEDGRGVGTQLPGFFAEYGVVAADLVFSVEGLDPDVAVFTEPAACAVHGVEVVAPRPGSSVLVVGAGPTGLLLAQLLAGGGATHVTVADPAEHKLRTASGLGVDRVLPLPLVTAETSASATVGLLAASPTGDGFDVVVEATGSTVVGALCLTLVRRGGTVLMYGVAHEEAQVAFSPYDLFRRELTIRGSFAEATSLGAAISALRTGRVRTDGLITHRVPLVDYADALEIARTDPTAHKIVVVP